MLFLTKEVLFLHFSFSCLLIFAFFFFYCRKKKYLKAQKRTKNEIVFWVKTYCSCLNTTVVSFNCLKCSPIKG